MCADAFTPALSQASVIARKSNIPWKELEGVAIILVLDTGEYFELDTVGLYLWKMLEQETTIAACASSLASVYDVTLDTAQQDVTEFVEELKLRDLITVR